MKVSSGPTSVNLGGLAVPVEHRGPQVHAESPSDDGALAFLRRAADGQHRIVSSGDLTTLQIAEARATGRFYVEPGGGLGWALLPWNFSTDKDKQREWPLCRRWSEEAQS